MRKKARDEHISDCNSRYFYSLFNAWKRKASIHSIEDADGTCYNQVDHIENSFVNHFKDTLAPDLAYAEQVDLSHIKTFGTVTDSEAAEPCKPVHKAEIEAAIKIANPHESPGLDGFNAHFYKVCWSIIGEDVTLAISDFFKSGKLLKQVKNTFITLIPKSGNLRTLLISGPSLQQMRCIKSSLEL